MDKTLEALNLYFKTLIVISATILVVAVGRIAAESHRVDYQISSLDRMDTAYKQLSGAIRADATAKYRQMFLDAVPSAGRDLRTSLERMEFVPVVFQARQTTVGLGVELTLPLTTKRQVVGIWQITQLFGWHNASADYPSVVFAPADVRDLLNQLQSDVQLRPLLENRDLLLVVVPLPGTAGSCSLEFESDTWDRSRQPLRATLPCKVKGSVDVSQNLAAFIPFTLPGTMIDQTLVTLTPADAVARLKQEAAKSSSSQDTVDFGGPKLDAKLALQVGPFLIVILLLLMVGLQSTGNLLIERDPKDGGFWFGPFLGFAGLAMIVAIVFLPTAASFVAAGEGNLLGLRDPTVEAFVAGGITLVLASFVYGSNLSAARAWKRRLNTPDASASTLG